ncbi:MAG: hypothetical protein KF788_22375 [Piscinibacter sp.]|nr:hypothetical protein [Piscinibacter sp.]
MDAVTQTHRALTAALRQLLKPLFRVLLRQSMSFVAFEELAKRLYVEVAMNDFAIEGKKPSISRASILSGLTRKEVQRLLAEPGGYEGDSGERYNRAARVLTGWTRDSEFLADDGEPRALPFDGETGFAALVRRHSGDMPARAVLDELVRVGAVCQREDGSYQLIARAYVPQRSPSDKLAILGADVADLVATIEHNMEHGETDPRFQRKVMYHSIPVTALPAFRKLSAAQGQALLERLDRWLLAHDTDLPDDGTGTGPERARVGVGIHYFEERLSGATPPSQGEPR